MNDEIEYDVAEAILFFIKDVNDEDVGRLLAHVTENFYHGSLLIMEENGICNKGILLYLLLNKGIFYNDIIMAICMIYKCFINYNLWKNSDKKSYKKFKTLLKKSESIKDITEHLGESKLIYVNDILKKVNKEDLKDWNKPFQNEIDEIMNILIEDFINKRLYIILGEYLCPMEPLKNGFIRFFKISKQEDRTSLIEYIKKYSENDEEKSKETGLRLDIQISKKQWENAHGIKAFKKIHKELIKAISYEPEICNWCNPDVNTKTRHKCSNCMILFDSLKKYTSSFNYIKEIHEIIYDNPEDIKDLRDERKEIIREWINSSNAVEKEKKYLYDLLDSTFAVKRL